MSGILAILAGIGSVACFTSLRRYLTDGEFMALCLAGWGLGVLAVWLATYSLRDVLWP